MGAVDGQEAVELASLLEGEHLIRAATVDVVDVNDRELPGASDAEHCLTVIFFHDVDRNPRLKVRPEMDSLLFLPGEHERNRIWKKKPTFDSSSSWSGLVMTFLLVVVL